MFDIIVAVFTLIMGVIGYRNGFVYTLICMMGWVVSVILAFVLHPYVTTFLKDHTGIFDFIHLKITEKMAATGLTPDVLLQSFPDVAKNIVGDVAEELVNSFGLALTTLVFSVLTFLLILILFKVATFTLTVIFSKHKRKGIIGAIDSILGLAAGLSIGVLLVFIFLVLVIPISAITGSTFLVDMIEGSVITKEFFVNNIILFIINAI